MTKTDKAYSPKFSFNFLFVFFFALEYMTTTFHYAPLTK